MPSNELQSERWLRIDKQFRVDFPHLSGWLSESENVVDLRLKFRADGTVLAIAKGFGSDGGPVVCFGVGYDVILAFIAIEATIQGDHWRFDKPYEHPKK